MTEQQDPPPADEPPSEIALDLPAHSFWRRNGITVGACVLAVVSLSIAIGVLASSSGGSTVAAAPASSSSGPTSSAPAAKKAATDKTAKATRATILSESGSTWSVRTAKGATLAVTITPQTQFGTPKAPATADQFPVGTDVVITGTVANGNATATRVIAGKAAAAAPASPSSTLTQS